MRQTLALVIGALILAVPAVAQPPGMPGHTHGMGPSPMAGMGGPAMCGPGMGGPMMGHGMLGMGLMPVLMQNADELKLSDEQLGKLHRIHFKRMGAGKESMQRARESRGGLAAALGDPAADDAAIRAAAKAHADAFAKLVDDAVAERSEMLAVLTADQKAKLKTLKPAEMSCEEGPGR